METTKKLKAEIKRLKNLQFKQDIGIKMATEALNISKEHFKKIHEENEILQKSKDKLDLIQNTLLEEYFKNTELERKRISCQIDNDKNKELIKLEVVKQAGPIISSVLQLVPLFTETKQSPRQEPPNNNNCKTN